ncbi:MAG: carboxypeptidase-like regulatory domain-containing protein, partial [Gaiellaceae bacterium]
MTWRAPLRLVLPILGVAALAGCGGSGKSSSSTSTRASGPVSYAKAQGVFAKYQCAACHPIVNPSLDMRPAHTYASIVGVQAVEDPRLVRVVAGDPGRSFLFQKIAGDPKLGDIPAIGARMPQNAPRMSQADIDTIRAWIEQGAKNAQGKTVGPSVPTPGAASPSPTGNEAKGPTGDATISGVVEDQHHKPLAGALVTLLLRGSDQPGGEEHYRVAATDASGHYSLTHAPTGQYLLKAYAPLSIYVSRIVALKSGQKAEVDFGLPRRVIPNPNVAAHAVTTGGRT